ncbi:MAG: DUF2182 domain-containing protein [Haloarculaceae archaeon]
MAESVRRHVGREELPVIALVTYAIALLAWIAVVARLFPMPGGGSATAMSAPGAPESMALANGATGIALYLVMWGTMMIAMMYPSSVPLFSLYRKTIGADSRVGTAARVGAFMGAYALVWTLTGLVPLAVNAVVPIAAVADEHGSLLVGVALVGLATYQLSPYKHRCLRYCRTPLGFLMAHHRPGVRGAAATSVRFSVFCVGCCWALFAVMVVVGSMNLLWMAGLTVVLSLERVVSWGDRLATAVGAVAGVVGFVLLAIGLA